jgi:transcriptional regulator with XRE-family HTH domain
VSARGQTPRMDDATVGRVYRAVRIRKRLRQVDVAVTARTSQDTVSRLERGAVGGMTVAQIRAIGEAIGVTLDLVPRWRGGELDRLLGARHSALHEAVAARFATLPGWRAIPEVTFSIYGERGAIDVLAWHEPTRTLLVIELKTEIVDVQELLGTLDRKRRLAPKVAAERGWRPATVATWVILAEGRTNRRRVAAHRTVLRAALPADGHAMRAWLDVPSGPIAALTFWPSTDGVGGIGRLAPVRRVRVARAAA